MESVFNEDYVINHIEDGLRWDLSNQFKLESGFMNEEVDRINVTNTDEYMQIAEIELYYGKAD